MAPVATARLNNIVWKLHERRGRVAELTEMRKRYIEKAYCAQIDSDKKLLHSRMHRLPPSLLRSFLKMRLEKLNRVLKQREQ